MSGGGAKKRLEDLAQRIDVKATVMAVDALQLAKRAQIFGSCARVCSDVECESILRAYEAAQQAQADGNEAADSMLEMLNRKPIGSM